MRYHVGGELDISRLLAIRSGYKIHNFAVSPWSVGFGLHIPMDWLARSETRLDYSYSPMDAFETTAHRFSLLFTFGVATRVLGLNMAERAEIAELNEKLRLELEAAEKARLSLQEAEEKTRLLQKEMAERLAQIQKIAAESEGKIEVEPQTEKRILVSMRINFDFDKANIRPEEFETMRQVGEILNTYPEAEVHVSGHTDSIGPEEYNTVLSQRRIDSVTVFLSKRENVSADRFYMPIGYGELRHIATNATEEGRFRNRRVEFLLFTYDAVPEMPEGSAVRSVKAVDSETIRIICNGSVDYTVKTFTDPDRLVIDFANIYLLSMQNTYELNQGPFVRARLGYHPEDRFTRVAIDLSRPVDVTTRLMENVVVIKLKNN
jgi:outer membrane protein OmpA-like peptidoglycan-associated protein